MNLVSDVPVGRCFGEPSLRVAGLLLRQKLAHERPLLLQLVHRRLDLDTAEVIPRQALDDFESLPVASNRERTDQPLLDSVTPVGANTYAVPIAGRRRLKNRTDAVHH